MTIILTFLAIRFLLHDQVVIQMRLSEYLIRALLTTFVPKRELFASIEELDGGLMSMGDDQTCRLVGRGTVHIRMYDGTLRELKEVRYIPSMTKNIISVGALEAEGLRGTLGEGVLKMCSGSLF